MNILQYLSIGLFIFLLTILGLLNILILIFYQLSKYDQKTNIIKNFITPNTFIYFGFALYYILQAIRGFREFFKSMDPFNAFTYHFLDFIQIIILFSMLYIWMNNYFIKKNILIVSFILVFIFISFLVSMIFGISRVYFAPKYETGKG
jgi:hypothetical protein